MILKKFVFNLLFHMKKLINNEKKNSNLKKYILFELKNLIRMIL